MGEPHRYHPERSSGGWENLTDVILSGAPAGRENLTDVILSGAPAGWENLTDVILSGAPAGWENLTDVILSGAPAEPERSRRISCGPLLRPTRMFFSTPVTRLRQAGQPSEPSYGDPSRRRLAAARSG